LLVFNVFRLDGFLGPGIGEGVAGRIPVAKGSRPQSDTLDAMRCVVAHDPHPALRVA